VKILINLAGWFGQSKKFGSGLSKGCAGKDLPGNHRGVDPFFERLIHSEQACGDMFDRN